MKLAVFTPLAPLRSGIADYSASLLPEIARHAEVDAFIDDGYDADPLPGVRIRNHREYRPADYDETLYQYGNNPHHIYIYDRALKDPGVALLHEYNLHHLVADATIKRDDWPAYLRELAYEGAPEDIAYGERVRRLEVGPDYEGVAMNRRVIEASKAVIVHSNFMVGQVRKTGYDGPVYRVPHGAWLPDGNRQRYRARLGVDETTPLIGIFGFLKPYKRIRESLRAMRRLVRVHPQAKMILVGEEHPDLPVRRMIEDFGLSDHVRVLGFVELDEFVEYIGACDICLNLRYPTVGETSGTLLRALGLGRAVIVSDVGAFSDLPDEIALKVPVDESETDLLFEFLNLLVAKPDLRRAMGARAREYVATECPWEKVGWRFVEVLSGKVAPETRGTAPRGLSPARVSPAHDADADNRPLKLRGSEEAPRDAGKVHEGQSPSAAPVSNGSTDQPSTDEPASASGAADILPWLEGRPNDQAYVRQHLTRLTRTLQLCPPGGPADAALEMGAYLHITPALQHRLGYGEVRGCYLGPVGKVNRREVTAEDGRTFACEIDHFDAETDVYPYPHGRFTLVVCCELLEHLYEDPMHLMAEVNRILRPGGRLVLSTPNTCSLRAVGATLLGYHPGLFHQFVEPNEKGERDPRHAREYAPRDVQALFEAAGFELERLETGPYVEQGSYEYEWVRHVLDRYELPRHLRDDCLHAVGRKTGPVQERYPRSLYVASGE